MAKINASEIDIMKARTLISEIVGDAGDDALSVLYDSAEMGMKSFRILVAIRPLVVSVWSGMADNGDPRRFALEGMIRDIDSVIGHWIVPDEGEDAKEEEGRPEKK